MSDFAAPIAALDDMRQRRIVATSRAVSARIAHDTTYARYWACYLDAAYQAVFADVNEFDLECRRTMAVVTAETFEDAQQISKGEL